MPDNDISTTQPLLVREAPITISADISFRPPILPVKLYIYTHELSLQRFGRDAMPRRISRRRHYARCIDDGDARATAIAEDISHGRQVCSMTVKRHFFLLR